MKSKKMIAFFLSLTMIAGSFPVMVSADETDAPEASGPAVIEETAEEDSDPETDPDAEEPEEFAEDTADVYKDGDDVAWSDFQEGIKATPAGETYVLTGNVTRNEGYSDYPVMIDRDITIDLGGYTIDSTGNAYNVFNIEHGKVTIKNGKISGRKAGDIKVISAYGDSGDYVILQDIVINNSQTAISSSVDLILYNCTLTGNTYAFSIDSGDGYSTDYDEDMIDLNGKIVIKDNYTDISLEEGKLIDIGNIGEGSSIGISMNEPGAFTGHLTELQQAKKPYFFSSNTDYYVALEDSKLVLKSTSFEVTSWDELYTAINTIPVKGYIRLMNDCVAASGSSTLKITSGKDVTIDLNGYSIDRNKKGRVFENEGKLTFVDNSTSKSGVVTGGFNTYSGAGIYNKGTLSLSGGSVTGNYLKFDDGNSKRGAGVYNNGGTVYINGGNITDNNPSDSVTVDQHYEGGGIFNSNGDIYFYSGTITGNRAHSGAGIYNYKGKVFIYDSSSMSDNIASGGSGNPCGGAVYNYGGTVTVKGGIFSGNNAASDGGAIYNGGTLTITGGSFTDNSARSGGAVYNGIIYQVADGSASIKNASFTSNESLYSGGAIYNQSAKNEMTIEDVSFIENKTTTTSLDSGNGGAICNGGILTISSDNTESSTRINGCGANSANNGGAVYNVGTLNITNWTATRNSAVKGGAICNKGTLQLDGISIVSNTATGNGGGIYLASDAGFNGTVEVRNNTVNEADDNVCIGESAKIVINDSFSGGNIGVNCDFDTGSESYVFTNGYFRLDTTAVEYFTSDKADTAVVFKPSTQALNPDCELMLHTYQPNVITGYDMTLAESLCFRLTIQLGDSIDRDSAYVMMQGPNDPEPRRVDLEPDSAGICVVPCSLYARQLDSDIKYALFDKDGLQSMVFNGTAISAYKINATQYLTAIKDGDYREEAKKLADAMLVYGGFSKAYLENKTENDRVSAMSAFAHRDDVGYYDANRPLNDYNSITVDSFENYKPSVFQGAGGSDYVGIRGQKAGLGYNIGYNSLSLVAKDKIALRLYFTNDITNADFEIFRTKNTSVSLNDGQQGDITNYTVGKEHGLYYIEIPDIAAYDIGTKIYVEFLTHYNGGSGGQPIFEHKTRWLSYGIEISPLSYAYTVMDYFRDSMFKTHADVYLSKALLRYSEDALAYKNATNQ